jgi:hypothetical protein
VAPARRSSVGNGLNHVVYGDIFPPFPRIPRFAGVRGLARGMGGMRRMFLAAPANRRFLCLSMARGAPCSLPQMAGGSGSASSLSRPSGFTHVTAHRIAQPPKATFVTRLQPDQLPAQAARQLPDQSTTLRVESSSTDNPRLRGELPMGDISPFYKRFRRQQNKPISPRFSRVVFAGCCVPVTACHCPID